MRLLTVREVADLLVVNRSTVLRWTQQGILPGFRLPSGALRYREDLVEAWLEERATLGGGASHLTAAPPVR